MSMTDPIADLLTRVRNGLKAQKATVLVPASKTKEAIVKVLIEEGYVDSVESVEHENHQNLSVKLRYYQGKPVIEKIERVSRPGRRVYRGKGDLPSVVGGLGIAVVSTSKGIMTEKQARSQGIGGEILCAVY